MYSSCVINCPTNACNPKFIVTYRRVIVLQWLCVSSGLQTSNASVELVDVSRRHCHPGFGQRINHLNSHKKWNMNIAGHSLTLQVDAEGIRHQGQPLVFALTYTGKKNEPWNIIPVINGLIILNFHFFLTKYGIIAFTRSLTTLDEIFGTRMHN